MIVLFLVVYFFSVLSKVVVSDISSSYLHGIPQNQYNALEAFYNSTNGPHWRWQVALTIQGFAMWNFTSLANPCSDNWQGVFCNCEKQNRCTISKIHLSGYNLTGTIPNSFDAFTDLTQLTLERNNLTDPFPDSLQSLQNLSILEMSGNLFEKFPNTIFSYKSLTEIDFSDNLLNGTLSSSISQLSSLSRLYLNTNFMSGSLPLGLWNLTQLIDLHLFVNFFTGTISEKVSQLTHLRRFVIYSNQFHGAIPHSFPVTKLDVLLLADNLFSRTIPANFQKAPLLTALYLSTNGFTGDFYLGNNNPHLLDIQIYKNFFYGNVTYLQDLHDMTCLFLSSNMFTNILPLANWTFLLEYEASNNYFTGSFPSFYSNLSYLDELNIGDNFLSGSLPPSTTQFDLLLTGFNISYNLFTGTIPAIGTNNKSVSDYPQNRTMLWYLPVVENLRNNRPLTNTTSPELQTLILDNNFFTGPLPDVLCLFSELSLISFSDNQLTGPIPTNYSLFNFTNQFTVGNNKLNGPIDSILSVFNSSTLLNVLDLSENEFTGTIPDETNTGFYEATARTLQVLNLGINCLTGSLPESLCQLSHLRTLILDGLTSSPNCVLYLFPEINGLNAFIHKNNFYGTLPSCLLEISGLQTFHSSGNGITGNLLSQLNISSKMNDLCLSHNELTGSIPLSIQEKSNWQTLDLSYNRLSGTLSPSFYNFLNNNDNNSEAILSLQINHLSGDIPSSLLTTTSSSTRCHHFLFCKEIFLTARMINQSIYRTMIKIIKTMTALRMLQR
jgi:Leucine-rich repeat (LRR) protein